jgi:hypothetical protein
MSFWSQLKGMPITAQVGVAGDVAVEDEVEVSVEIWIAMSQLHPLKILGISQP